MEDFVVPGLLLARAVAFWVFIVVKNQKACYSGCCDFVVGGVIP